MTAWRSVGSQSHTWKSDSIVVPCVLAGMRPPERIAGTRTPPVVKGNAELAVLKRDTRAADETAPSKFVFLPPRRGKLLPPPPSGAPLSCV